MRDHPAVVPHGGLTKRPLVANDPDAARLDMTDLAGVVAYEPDEFTFTAYAGTRLHDIVALLAGHRQYMPFDPPLLDRGATIGGTLAAGLNGPGRFRFGGLRDFIIGVRFVDGTGRLIAGGGRVVKNAAGFDLPKLMVGSMGRLGVLVELTFKVFPAPSGRRTIRVACTDLSDSLGCIAALVRRPLELEALELEPPATLMIRVAGDEEGLDHHARRVGESTARPFEVYAQHDDTAYWRSLREFDWVDDEHSLVKIPITLSDVAVLDRTVEPLGLARRYGVGANVAYIAWPAARSISELDPAGVAGMVMRGEWPADASPRIGIMPADDAPFARAVKHALDPQQRLPALV